MKDAILKFVIENPETSFVELCRHIPGFEGDDLLSFDEYPSVIIWPHVSEVAKLAIGDLIASNDIELHYAPAYIYGIDGTQLHLPLATEVQHYNSPHWLPVKIMPGARHQR